MVGILTAEFCSLHTDVLSPNNQSETASIAHAITPNPTAAVSNRKSCMDDPHVENSTGKSATANSHAECLFVLILSRARSNRGQYRDPSRQESIKNAAELAEAT